jgi:hypothetical protein
MLYFDEKTLRELIREENQKLVEELRKTDEKKQPPLSIGQLAIRYSVSKATIHNWINRKVITGFKIGKGRFFDVSEVERGLKDYEHYTGIIERLNKKKQ